MCIFTFTPPVQSQVNEPSCVLLPLQYLYKARTMSGHLYCYRTGSVMVTIHMTAHFPGFVEVV
jgi:hypothetical protein